MPNTGRLESVQAGFPGAKTIRIGVGLKVETADTVRVEKINMPYVKRVTASISHFVGEIGLLNWEP